MLRVTSTGMRFVMTLLVALAIARPVSAKQAADVRAPDLGPNVLIFDLPSPLSR